MTDFASLGIRIDTTGVEKGKSDLDQLTGAAQRAEQAAEGVGPAYQSVARQVQSAAAASRNAAPPMIQQSQSMQAATLSAKQYSQALRMVPAQITDIVTGLVSGQPAYMVAIQQGGQLRDSFGGVGAALRGVMSVISPMRLAMIGAAGAAGLLVKAFLDGQREGYELSKAITLSGNAAGVTRDQLLEMSEAIGSVIGTQRQAASTLAQLVSTGRISAENLQEFATAAQELGRVGQPVEETVKHFAELGRDPLNAAKKLHEQFGFLTVEVYRQIKALEAEGRILEAGEVAQRAYAAAGRDRTKQLETDLGILQRAARATGDAFRKMGEAILDIGRPDTISEQIANLQAKIDKELQRARDSFVPGRSGALWAQVQERVLALQHEIDALQKKKRADEEAAAAEARRAREMQRVIEREKESARVYDALTQKFEQASRSRLESSLNAIQRELDRSLNGYALYAQQLDALRSADLVGEQEYWEAKRELVARDRDAQVKALQDERSRLAAEMERLEQARTTAGNAAAKQGTDADRIKAELPYVREINQTRERLLDIEAQIAQVRARSGAELSKISIEETKSINAQAKALREAQAAADDYIASLRRQNERRLEGLGRGDRAREIIEARNELDAQFERDRQRLERERRADPNNARLSSRIDSEIEILRQTYQRALEETDRFYVELEERQADASRGARAAIENYLDSAKNVAASTQEAFTSAFRGMEDALVEFVTTGKADFKSLAESIIADLLRIQIRASLSSIFGNMNLGGLLGGLFGGLSPSGGIGAGGGSVPVSGGALFADVGIRRVPQDNQVAILHKDEAVIPASLNPFAGGKGLGTNVTIYSPVSVAPGTSTAQVDAIVQQRNAELELKIMESLQRQRPGYVIG